MKNRVRLSLQLLFFSLVLYVALRPAVDTSYTADFEKYCPLGGVSSLLSKFSQGSMACNMSEVQVSLGLGLLIAVLLIGKLFCSFICPLGTLSEYFGRQGERLGLRINIPHWLDGPMRSLKYIILFITFYYTATTSELFCRTYDPYFFTANLFSHPDALLYYAIPAVVILFAGAFFFRLLWCRYFCPLGALSNIFLSVINITVSTAVFLTAKYFLNPELHLLYLPAVMTIGGMINELFYQKQTVSAFPKIHCDRSRCTSCGLCEKACPQGIKITETDVVRDLDCTLCSDCIHACGKKGALSVMKSKRLKYLAPVSVILVAALSLGASSLMEFSTISERWGSYAASGIKVFEYEGLKNVKCFGSAMSLKEQLSVVNGIVGLDAYASSHRVKIYYDPKTITPDDIKRALFSPVNYVFSEKLKSNDTMLGVFKAHINGMFDALDTEYLTAALSGRKGICGFSTEYGEPVGLTVYYDPSEISERSIVSAIESRSIQISKNGRTETVSAEFSIAGAAKTTEYISVKKYRQRMFIPFNEEFNGYEDYDKRELSVLEFPLPEAEGAGAQDMLLEMASHLSGEGGIVRFETVFDEKAYCRVYFDPALISHIQVSHHLTSPVLHVFVDDSTKEDRRNPFSIDTESGRLYKRSTALVEN